MPTGTAAPVAVTAPLKTRSLETAYEEEVDREGKVKGSRLYKSPTPGTVVSPRHETVETLTNSPPTNHAADDGRTSVCDVLTASLPGGPGPPTRGCPVGSRTT